MNPTQSSDDRRDEAIAWFVRLQEVDDEAVWLDYQAWLDADPRNAAAYAEVEAFWVDLDDLDGSRADHGDTGRPDGPGAEVIVLGDHRRNRSRWRALWAPTAAAAAAVAAIFTFTLPQFSPTPENARFTYRTGPDEIRKVVLADGSRLTLNRNSTIAVRLEKRARQAVLTSGEVAFDIHHEQRPFIVQADDRQIRVLGTEFDVVKQDGAFTVTVRRGLVAVSNDGRSDAQTRLPAGRRLTRLPGEDRDTVTAVAADDAFAWQRGSLVYADRPIAELASDLSRYLGVPVGVAPALRQMRVTGVLKTGSDTDLRRQVEALLPIRIADEPGEQKSIVLVDRR